VTELGQGDIDEEIDFKTLWKQPLHPINVTILYIYSLETFIPHKLNVSSRDRDHSMVENLGAFAMALKTILYCSNKYRKDALKGPFTVYRGLCLMPDQLDDYR